ncbi:hypothetical protein F4813DRAFT_357895 [Daldinia decipiens]|uniref:uncharacterized protein n=1 Tax=Daldinia decipiens TaxID=326647 RepID=UPI0020C39E24|nr:uncharacterized protein F4813DRAFT_357895 [Daldinia decipiens]KAI1658272.1 hypothetical protein F4813DRAFT_357895 [Daldinia decipiens]
MSETIQLNREDPTTRPVSRVYQWLLDTSRKDNGCHDGIITRLFDVGNDLYTALMRDLSTNKTLSKSLYRQLQSGHSQYIIWARDYDVEGGGLDSLLQNSQKLYISVIEILATTCAALRNVCVNTILDSKLENLCRTVWIVTEEASYIAQDTSDSSDGESDTSSDENQDSNESLQDTIETLLNEIECLFDLGPRLEEPVFDCCIEEQTVLPRPPTTSGPARYFVDIVLTKFPKCDFDLAIALGHANWDSTLRLQEKRNVTSKSPSETTVDKPTTIFQDSGLESSLPKISLRATTILSSNGDDANGDKPVGTRVPSLPSEIEVGQLFSCMICGEYVEKQDMRVWMRHLLADLQPWICCQIACPCDRKPFETREEWVEHLYKGHKSHPEWDDKTCPLCLTVINEGGLITLSHVARHLEEISLAALPCYPEDEEEDEDRRTTVSSSIPESNWSNFEFYDTIKYQWALATDLMLPKIELSGTLTDQQITDQLPPTINSTTKKTTKKTAAASLPSTTAKLWYCCLCEFGPCTVSLIPTCPNCIVHHRCSACLLV